MRVEGELQDIAINTADHRESVVAFLQKRPAAFTGHQASHPASAMEEIPMTNLVTYTRSGPMSRIVMDDGKVSVMSIDMLEELHAAFDEAERDKTVVVLTGRGKTFSAGFDLKVLASGSAHEMYTIWRSNGCHFNRLVPTMKSG
jgi:enoyl-CoA hydratase/carnithine racemase